MEKLNLEALKALEEVSEKELSEMSGADGSGVFSSLTHECYMNTWQFLGTCCGW